MDSSLYTPQSIEPYAIEALLESLDLPKPESITKHRTQGQYHLIYTLEYTEDVLTKILASLPQSPLHPHHRSKLLLRVAGRHLPQRKTENESAILLYISQHGALRIPTPVVVRYDSSIQNPIGHEFQIMTVCPGIEVDSVFRAWDETTKVQFLDQVIELLTELHSIPISQIGGFRFANDGKVEVGPLCEEYLWQMPGIEEHWLKHDLEETPETINAQGPFDTWTDLNIGWLERYIHAIEIHPHMAEFRDMVPRLERFQAKLRDGGPPEWHLNDMRIVLAHRDLHFGNILYHEGKISGIIDWEFAGAAPFCKWDPPRAFLASLPYDDEGLQRKRGWVEQFQSRCKDRGIDWRVLMFDVETGWSGNEQALVHKTVDYMRCIFEVAPTGDRLELTRSWRKIVEDQLDELGIS